MERLAQTAWFPFVALLLSNVFMTFAWYRHLRFKEHQPLWIAIAASWGIAFFEYCIAVPANRYGSQRFSLFQLKLSQEVITLLVFVGFAFFYYGARPQWNHFAAFLCLLAAVGFAFWPAK
jgi:uncharacterized protein